MADVQPEFHVVVTDTGAVKVRIGVKQPTDQLLKSYDDERDARKAAKQVWADQCNMHFRLKIDYAHLHPRTQKALDRALIKYPATTDKRILKLTQRIYVLDRWNKGLPIDKPAEMVMEGQA